MKRRVFIQSSLLVSFLGASGLYRLFGAELKPKQPGGIILKPELVEKPVELVDVKVPAHRASHTTTVLRAEDLLSLEFEFFNLGLKSGRLQRLIKNKAAYIAVHFQPQHIYEQSFPKGKDLQAGKPPVATLLSGPSRLVFRLPSQLNSIAYTLEALLAWEKWELSLAPTAIPVMPAKLIKQDQAQINPLWVIPLLTGKPKSSQSTRSNQIELRSKGMAEQQTVIGTIKTDTFIEPPEIAPPGTLATAIEAPYHLILSPHQQGGWVNSPDPRTIEKSANKVARTELWHTRLGVKTKQGVDTKDKTLRTVRAIWSPEYTKDTVADPFCLNQASGKAAKEGCPTNQPPDQRCSAMLQNDRRQIVELTSDYSKDAAKYVRPVQVNNLMLSTLGAWLDLRGDWDVQPSTKSQFTDQILDLESWVHRATMGRDQFVRLVYRGYLVPFGHRVSLIAVTEREIESVPVRAAYLRTRYFIVVREVEKIYSKVAGSKSLVPAHIVARSLPFRRVRLKTLITPMLDPVLSDADYWVQVNGGEDFQFHVEAEDWNGRICEFSMPMRYSMAAYAEKPLTGKSDSGEKSAHSIWGGAVSVFKSLLDRCGQEGAPLKYNDDKPERRTAQLHGQSVGYVPNKQSSAKEVLDNALETRSITFKVGDRTATVAGGELMFYPIMQQAEVRHAAASQFAGEDILIAFEYHGRFLAYGFDKHTDKKGNILGLNQGEVYAQILYGRDRNHNIIKTVPLTYHSSKSIGGIAMPNLNIVGLSREFGPLGGTPDRLYEIASARLKDDFFKDFFSDAKLIGGISLGDIISNDFNGGKNIPAITSHIVNTENGPATKTLYDWYPQVKGNGLFEPFKQKDGGDINKTLSIHAEYIKPLNQAGRGEFTIHGQLKKFSLTLIPGSEFIKIAFESLSFISHNGEKPDFDVQLRDSGIEFIGPLKYIQALDNNIPRDGFSDPPHLSVTAEGAAVGYTMRLPDVSGGAWGYHDLSMGAALNLPFNGDPLAVNFNFASAERPFTLTYNAMGGDGYVQLTAGSNGMQSITASLAARAEVKVNFGSVAKGHGYFRIGVAFQLKEEAGGTTVALTGFVATGGSVLAFGIAVINVGAMLALEYRDGQASAQGEITISVDTPIKDFSVTVPLVHTLDSGGLVSIDAPESEAQRLAGLYDEAYFEAFA